MDDKTPPKTEKASSKEGVEPPKKPNQDRPSRVIPSPADIQREFQSMIQDKFGGSVQVMSMDPAQQAAKEAEGPSQDEEQQQTIKDFSHHPKDLVSLLNKKIIGQEEAKRALSIAVCDHYRHLQAEARGDVSTHYQKQNVLFLGPTGVGKTYLVRAIADYIGVPFVKADATRFSETGFVGANVDDLIRDLVQQAKGNTKLAESGIVYVDEVDKIAGSPQRGGKDVNGRGVQFGFLRLLEDAEVDLNGANDMASQMKMFMSFQKKGHVSKDLVRTKNILFIFSGAFTSLDDIIKKRVQQQSIGIGAEIFTEKEKDSYHFLKQVQPEDFVEFGFEREFVGRLPVITSCHPLSKDHLFHILQDSETSIIKQYQRSFSHYGIELSFSEEALEWIASRAARQKTGARALVQVCESLLRNFKYELPERGIQKLEINAEVIKNPEGYLQYLIESHQH